MKRTTIIAGVLSVIMAGSLALPLSSYAVAKKVSVAGKARIVLQGTASSQSSGSLTVHVTSATANAKVFKNTDVGLKIGATTKITKGGRKISPSAVKLGSKLKVWAIYDRKLKSVSSVTWIKVVK